MLSGVYSIMITFMPLI